MHETISRVFYYTFSTIRRERRVTSIKSSKTSQTSFIVLCHFPTKWCEYLKFIFKVHCHLSLSLQPPALSSFSASILHVRLLLCWAAGGLNFRYWKKFRCTRVYIILDFICSTQVCASRVINKHTHS